MASTETTGLIQTERNSPLRIKFNIEKLRVFGLLMGIAMLLVGRFLTDVWPTVWGRGRNPDKIEDSYIWKVFGFAHTCVYIDFNPSKTVAALLINFVVLPLMFFTYFNHLRIQVEFNNGKITQSLFSFSKMTWKFRVGFFMYFFMVFVNSPDEPFTDPKTLMERINDLGWRNYLLHYLPFMFWQLALALMAFEQTWFKCQTNNIPHGIPKDWLYRYLIAITVVYIYYTVYIWCHMFGFESLPGYDNVPWAKTIMITYIILTAIIPSYVGYCDWKGIHGVRPPSLYTLAFYESE